MTCGTNTATSLASSTGRCEGPIALKYTNLERISTDTVKVRRFGRLVATSHTLGLDLQDDQALLCHQVGLQELQSDDNVTLFDVRDIFNALIERHPSVKDYLDAEPL
ncbi:hypothetical protein GQ600_23489 [Phytophthora cactorum]|nr:hypothetical protein GQ600_23489 [Phytophthora cactorum]